MAIEMFRDLVKENHLASFLGLNMWHVFLTLWMCLLLGSVFFQKSLGPGICSCNPTSLLLDSRLQSTVSLFGYSISLCLCVLRHIVFSVLNFHYPQPPSFERPHQVRVGVVESSCNTPPVFSHLQIQNVSAFTTVCVVYSCDSLFPWKVRQGCRVAGTLLGMCRWGACLAMLDLKTNQIGHHGPQVRLQMPGLQVPGLHVRGRGHVRGFHILLHLLHRLWRQPLT